MDMQITDSKDHKQSFLKLDFKKDVSGNINDPANMAKLAAYFVVMAGRSGIVLDDFAKANLTDVFTKLQHNLIGEKGSRSALELIVDLLTYHGKGDRLSIGSGQGVDYNQTKFQSFFSQLLKGVNLSSPKVSDIADGITNNLTNILYSEKIHENILSKNHKPDHNLTSIDNADAKKNLTKRTEALQLKMLEVVHTAPDIISNAIKNNAPELELKKLFYQAGLDHGCTICFSDYDKLSDNAKTLFSLKLTGKPQKITSEAEFKLAVSHYQYDNYVRNGYKFGNNNFDEMLNGTLGLTTFKVLFMDTLLAVKDNADGGFAKDIQNIQVSKDDSAPLNWLTKQDIKTRLFTIHRPDSSGAVRIAFNKPMDFSKDDKLLHGLAEKLALPYLPLKGVSKEEHAEFISNIQDYLKYYMQNVVVDQSYSRGDQLTLKLPGKDLISAFGDHRKALAAEPPVFPKIAGSESAHVAAFLATIREAESHDQYDVIFGNVKVDLSLGAHPEKVVTSSGISSSAFGAYQMMPPTMKALLAQISPQEKKGQNLISPPMQDRLAKQLLINQGVTAALIVKNPLQAFHQVADQWAALPTPADHSYYNTKGKRYDEYGGTAQNAKSKKEIMTIFTEKLRYYMHQAGIHSA